jgi:hypothetical protein
MMRRRRLRVLPSVRRNDLLREGLLSPRFTFARAQAGNVQVAESFYQPPSPDFLAPALLTEPFTFARAQSAGEQVLEDV